ncbi:hypothetical protein D3C87_1147370 [compost metagenome]
MYARIALIDILFNPMNEKRTFSIVPTTKIKGQNYWLTTELEDTSVSSIHLVGVTDLYTNIQKLVSELSNTLFRIIHKVLQLYPEKIMAWRYDDTCYMLFVPIPPIFSLPKHDSNHVNPKLTWFKTESLLKKDSSDYVIGPLKNFITALKLNL